jgi:hypothetical protein
VQNFDFLILKLFNFLNFLIEYIYIIFLYISYIYIYKEQV